MKIGGGRDVILCLWCFPSLEAPRADNLEPSRISLVQELPDP